MARANGFYIDTGTPFPYLEYPPLTRDHFARNLHFWLVQLSGERSRKIEIGEESATSSHGVEARLI